MNVHDFTGAGWPPIVNLLVTDGNGSLTVPEKKVAEFYSKITKTESGCWEWQGPKTKGGYGRLNITNRYWYTHRLTYELHVARIPTGRQMDHLCRNRVCCNPAHLEPVTQRENIMRSPVAIAAVNAAKTQCINGHALTEDNVLPNAPGRRCATCARARNRKSGNGLPSENVCRNGHPRTPENTTQRQTCRTCAAAARKRYNDRIAGGVQS